MAAETKVPRQPANRHVLGQAERWGWKVVSRKRDMVQVKHVITGDKLDLMPEGSHRGNDGRTLTDLYRLTGVNPEGFWQGPSQIDIKNINAAREAEVARKQRGQQAPEPLTQSVGAALAEAKVEGPKPAAEPARAVGAKGGVNDTATVTPKDDVGREAIIEAAKLPGGASIQNQCFVVLAKTGMPMTTDQVHAELKHLARHQVQQALTNMSSEKSGNAKVVITRIQKGLYQTKAAPISNRTRTDVVSESGIDVRVETHRTPAMAEMPAAPSPQSTSTSTSTPRGKFTDCGRCGLADRHVYNEDCVYTMNPASDPDYVAPAETPQDAPSAPPAEVDEEVSTIEDDELDELLDLIFPDGFRFKARHLGAIETWKRATRDMINAITND